MLVLTLKKDDGGVWINDNIHVELIESRPNKVRLGFTAPREIEILRDVVRERLRSEAQGEVDEH